MHRADRWIAAALLAVASPALAQVQGEASEDAELLAQASAQAERQLRQTFTNLAFEDFGPSPVEGPIYQAMAGGRMLYFAPQSEHLLFAAVYDRNGVNLTAQAQDSAAHRKLAKIDTSQALAIGPPDAPVVIEFTDPDCPHCRALERFWLAKAAEGKPVRRLVFFVTGMHPEAGAKAEHILCSPDPAAAFKAIYTGAAPATLAKCAAGRDKVAAHTALVGEIGIGGTPTLVAYGEVISGFRQAEIEAFLDAPLAKDRTKAPPHGAR